MTMEEWKPVSGKPWNKIYEVSNYGRVRYAPRIVPPRLIEGYPNVTFNYRGTQHSVRVHRLVASAFIREPNPGEIVNHLDADRKNCTVENLEWTTHKGNIEHTISLGRFPFGTDHPLGKIDFPIACEMRRSGHSYRSIADRFGVTREAAWAMFSRAKKRGRYKD